jgi:hypothetical protein
LTETAPSLLEEQAATFSLVMSEGDGGEEEKELDSKLLTNSRHDGQCFARRSATAVYLHRVRQLTGAHRQTTGPMQKLKKESVNARG